MSSCFLYSFFQMIFLFFTTTTTGSYFYNFCKSFAEETNFFDLFKTRLFFAKISVWDRIFLIT